MFSKMLLHPKILRQLPLSPIKASAFSSGPGYDSDCSDAVKQSLVVLGALTLGIGAFSIYKDREFNRMVASIEADAEISRRVRKQMFAEQYMKELQQCRFEPAAVKKHCIQDAMSFLTHFGDEADLKLAQAVIKEIDPDPTSPKP